jgi:hypothetical protein
MGRSILWFHQCGKAVDRAVADILTARTHPGEERPAPPVEL